VIPVPRQLSVQLSGIKGGISSMQSMVTDGGVISKTGLSWSTKEISTNLISQKQSLHIIVGAASPTIGCMDDGE